MKRSDAELVKAAGDGDVDSFRRLYERHYGLAVGIARTRLWDRHLAEDTAQESDLGNAHQEGLRDRAHGLSEMRRCSPVSWFLVARSTTFITENVPKRHGRLPAEIKFSIISLRAL